MKKMYELNDAELDAVAAGAGAGAGAGGLVAAAVAAAVDVTNVLNNPNVQVLDNNHVNVLNNALNGNKTNVGAGVLVNLLGGPSAIRGSFA
jgi:hypothetical protein